MWWTRKRITPGCAYCGLNFPKVKTHREARETARPHVLQCAKNPFNEIIAEQVRRLRQSNIILRSIALKHPEILVPGSVRHDQIKKNEDAIALRPSIN